MINMVLKWHHKNIFNKVIVLKVFCKLFDMVFGLFDCEFIKPMGIYHSTYPNQKKFKLSFSLHFLHFIYFPINDGLSQFNSCNPQTGKRVIFYHVLMQTNARNISKTKRNILLNYNKKTWHKFVEKTF